MEYRRTQTAGLTIVIYAAFAVVVSAIAFTADTAAGWLVLAPFVGILAVVVVFSRLTVTVTSGLVTAAFAWGWPRRRVELATVRAVHRVRNKWYYGWGIRKVPRGWMFNVWGLDAVELELESGKVFRIGTDEPDELVGTLTLQVR